MKVGEKFGGGAKGVSVIALALAGMFLLALVAIGLVSSDVYGKLTETQPGPSGAQSPTVVLVLHRIMPDQNAIEASAILIVSDIQTMNEIRKGAVHLSAIVRDGMLNDRYPVSNQVTLGPTAYQPDVDGMSAESSRFYLPTQPSVGPYPFDDVSVRPIVKVFRLEGTAYPPFSLHIRKALPGRMLKLGRESQTQLITLTRPTIQKMFVLTVALIIWFLTMIITIELRKEAITTIQDLLAAAGFIVTAVGFRDVLGFSRLPTTGALEVAIIGIPIVLVSFSMAVSLIRRRRSEQHEEAFQEARPNDP